MDLPVETQTLILSHINDVRVLANCAATCSLWRDIIERDDSVYTKDLNKYSRYAIYSEFHPKPTSAQARFLFTIKGFVDVTNKVYRARDLIADEICQRFIDELDMPPIITVDVSRGILVVRADECKLTIYITYGDKGIKLHIDASDGGNRYALYRNYTLYYLSVQVFNDKFGLDKLDLKKFIIGLIRIVAEYY